MTDAKTRKVRLKSLRAVAVGNALEWFDWTLYATFSAYLASNLFDKTDSHSALLATLAVFAAGFFARPVGGLLFGRLGDRWGRKNVLVVTMLLLAFSSLGIAFIPSYEQVGLTASVLLTFFRLLQGLAHGGETGVSYTYVAEIAPNKHRGLWSSSVYAGVILGVIAATLVATSLTSILDSVQMNDYGWRIGFAIGGVLGIYAILMRRSVEESHVFEEQQHRVETTRKLSRSDMFRITRNLIMLNCTTNVAYYTWVTFAPATAISKGMDPNDAYTASLLAMVLCVVWLPVCGMISDRFGRKPVIVAWGLCVFALTIPIATMVTKEPTTLFFAQVIALGAWALIGSIFPAVLAEQVPTQARAQGVGFVSSVSVAIFGGTAPYLSTYLAGIGQQDLFHYYLMALGLVAIAAGLIIRETAGVDLSHIDAVPNQTPTTDIQKQQRNEVDPQQQRPSDKVVLARSGASHTSAMPAEETK